MAIGSDMTSSDMPSIAVILVTPVITAIGCDDGGDGNPDWRRKPPERSEDNHAVRSMEGRMTARRGRATT